MRRARARGLAVRAALAVRHSETRRRGVRPFLQPTLRDEAHRTALRERLRPAPGSPRRGGRRRDLPRRARTRRAGEDLRRRRTDARLRLRRRRRTRDDLDGRPGQRRLQRRDRTRDVGRRAVRAMREGRRLGRSRRACTRAPRRAAAQFPRSRACRPRARVQRNGGARGRSARDLGLDSRHREGLS